MAKMVAEFSSQILVLYLLLVTCVHGRGAREQLTENHGEGMINLDHGHKQLAAVNSSLPSENNVLRLPGSDGEEGKDDSDTRIHGELVRAHHSFHMDHNMDLQLAVFFTLNDLKLGTKIPVYFPKKDHSKSPHLLSREEADKIPFSYEKLASLLQFFSFSRESPQGKAMEATLRECGYKPIKGETKTCATSMESMLDYSQGVFGLGSDFKAVSTTFLTKSSVLFQNYTVVQLPKVVPAPKIVACHTMPYPYAVFYCHSQETENRVFVVSLLGENGERVEALAVCHMDTSQWNRDHPSFKVLGIEPGSSHVCHFFPEDHLVYVPMPTMSNRLDVM